MHPPKFEIISGSTLGEPNLYAFSTDQHRILLDCGTGYDRPFDVCFLSHAHLDHSIKLDEIAKSKNIWMSENTKSWLHQTGRAKIRVHIESDKIKIFKFHKKYDFGDISITPLPSGHISGSAMFLLESQNYRALYTSDFCLHPIDEVTPIELNINNIDLLISESSLSNLRIEQGDLLENRRKLKAFCELEGPSLIITRRVGDLDLIKTLAHTFLVHENALGSTLHTDAKQLLSVNQKIIVAGNLELGTASEQLATALLSNPNANIALINGVQRTKEGIGLLKTARRSRIQWGYYSGRLRAKVSAISLRNHPSREEIVFFIENINPRKTMIVHGQDSGRFAIAKLLKKRNQPCIVPSYGYVYSFGNTI